MLVFDLEFLKATDELDTIRGSESYQSKFSLNLGSGLLIIKDMGTEIYRLPFPIPIGLSIQDIPGTITSGNSQRPNGSVKSSYMALVGEQIQPNQKISVFFSASSALLSS